MKIPSGSITQYIYFVAVDATDLKTRETGLAAFTVYRSRDGGAATAYTTPTVIELSAANMPGVYALLIDEDTTIGATHATEEYVVHITHAGMTDVTRSIELYDPTLVYGTGVVLWPYVVTSSVDATPIPDVDVEVRTLAGITIWRGTTDVNGVSLDIFNNQPWLMPATYNFYRTKVGVVFNNPDVEAVS